MKTHKAVSLYVKNPNLKRLTAQWKTTDEPCFADPYWVQWTDGTPSTVEEFRSLELSTSCTTFTKGGEMQKHLFPDIVGTVSFEQQSRDWVIRGAGVIVTALNFPDRDASDFDIRERVFLQPVVYAVRIVRN